MDARARHRTLQLDDPDATIDTTGVTRLCLIERRDQEDATPPDPRSENELKLYSFEEGEGFQPYLEVFWGGPMPAEATNPTPNSAESQNPASGESPSSMAVIVGAAVIAAAAIIFLISRRRTKKC